MLTKEPAARTRPTGRSTRATWRSRLLRHRHAPRGGALALATLERIVHEEDKSLSMSRAEMPSSAPRRRMLTKERSARGRSVRTAWRPRLLRHRQGVRPPRSCSATEGSGDAVWRAKSANEVAVTPSPSPRRRPCPSTPARARQTALANQPHPGSVPGSSAVVEGSSTFPRQQRRAGQRLRTVSAALSTRCDQPIAPVATGVAVRYFSH